MKKKLIAADLYRIHGKKMTFRNWLSGMRSKGYQYLFFLRQAANTRSSIMRLIYRVILRRLSYKYGFQIPYSTTIGPGLFIGHFGTLVIAIHAKIGANCNIAHNVTIGAARGKRAGAPTTGDRVWIGTGAVLVGKINIGSDVLIAPNAYVNFDVPDHSLVLGNPAKIIAKQNPTQDYINNQWLEE